MRQILEQALNGQCIQFHRTHKQVYQDIMELTRWLPSDAPPLERAYCVYHNLSTIPLCPVCGANVKWAPTKKQYTPSCGDKQCRYAIGSNTNKAKVAARTDEQKLAIKSKRTATIVDRYGTTQNAIGLAAAKRVTTMMDRYGVEYTACSPELREKMASTNEQKYGTTNVLSIPHVRAKIKQTMLDRYGTEWHQQSTDGKAKRQATNIEKYGNISPLTSPDIKQKINATMMERYGTINAATIGKKKREATMKHRYGVVNYKQSHIPSEVLDLLDSKEWLINQHHIQRKTLVQIAEQLSVDPKTVGQRLLKFNIEAKRFGTSVGEQQLIDFLQSLGLNLILRSRSIISPYELDIVILEHNIAIEYCGLYWHSDIHPRMNANYHLNKHNLCREQGLMLLTIYEDEWKYKQDIVKAKLRSILNINDQVSIPARKCDIVDVSTNIAKAFFNQYHIQGYGRGSIKYGLMYQGQLVAIMSFINTKNGTYELNRYATSAHVNGGFSKLLSHFRRHNIWTKIISYADKRWGNGNVYIRTGFIATHESKPSYWYLSPDKEHRIHRSHFRHSVLQKILSNYDPLLTEFQNCDDNGILRIWDCGLIRYELLNG